MDLYGRSKTWSCTDDKHQETQEDFENELNVRYASMKSNPVIQTDLSSVAGFGIVIQFAESQSLTKQRIQKQFILPRVA